MAAGCACTHQPDESGAAEPVTLETAAAYLKDGEYGKAIESYSALISEDSANAEYYLGRAQAYAASGSDENLQSAEADYKKALELDDTMADAYIGLAQVYADLDDSEAALQTLEEGILNITDANEDGEYDDELELLNMKMAEISSTGTEGESDNGESAGKPAVTGEGINLSLSDISYEYVEGDAGANKNASGMMAVHFNVTGPANIAQVRIGGFNEQLTDVEKIAARMTETWKEAESGMPSENIPEVPFEMTNSFPVYEDDFGKTLQVLLIGIDANMDMVGYTVVEVAVTR